MINKSPDAILLHYANECIRDGFATQAGFCHDLLLPALIKAGLEQPEEHTTADEYEKWRSSKVRHLNGILKGHTNLPLRWLWCWLDILPGPYKSAARKDLLAQGGLMDIQLAGLAQGAARGADLPLFMREMADVIEASAVVAADGKYDGNDDPEQLVKLANEFSDVMQVCMAQMQAIGGVVDLSGSRAGKIVQMCKPTK